MTYVVPRGFEMAGVACGIKKSGKDDLTLIHIPSGGVAAGVYTTNLVHAAPVTIDRARTPSANFRALVVNSGNANACTGERGMRDALEMCRLAGEAVGATAEQTLVMSTGIIGVFLPMEKIASGIAAATARLASDEAAFIAAAKGIMTTDAFMKVVSKQVEVAGSTVTLSGMCKGAGMIGPQMATMLAVMMTDANITPADARALLQRVADQSFNCISVEGHMSTNDTLLLLASGAASSAPLAGDDLLAFEKALLDACIELATQIPDDGEGATHLIEIEVRGTKSPKEARTIAQTIANSALVKTAITGGDPNWGRIVSAAGYAGVPFDPAGVDLTINGHPVYAQGSPLPFDPKTVSTSMKENRKTHLLLTLREGEESIRFWTSDLTVDYVRFNADYTT
ncbi:arginine biosynthesis bifunctional protein ArgJ [Pirellula staleyi DSM 6068]|uniref:Arginine biosynthesis bifunctional protein ArgJ n=1 Tax=Pirellula staleyi (strain ATCC 27377 / DSM 6068 / ICPB 4128) TaxID=530564 RepID=D2QWM4_PIRSD|nr:bifunctional glutamate N-acetyltransferase/amino-acid acetyltransferase ArgJ [Pirellula staleyi]ADB17827.1 arginine biosynthesis bifunctional protein ArgJ [Pirellula staleyi DSM 6068]